MQSEEPNTDYQWKRLLTVGEAGDYIALGAWAVRRLVYQRRLAHVKVGRRILLDKMDLDAFIESCKETTGE